MSPKSDYWKGGRASDNLVRAVSNEFKDLRRVYNFNLLFPEAR